MESDIERNAQDWFRFMVDTNLAPGLRALGFFGVGRRFRIEGASHWGEVLVEQARSFTARAVRFTVHVGVISRDEWAEQLRVRPYYPANEVTRTHAGWQAPIGELVTVAGHSIGELWWELEVGRPFDSLSNEVLTAVREFALPAIRTHMDRT
ncbi:hypothetical protein BLA60_19920 [Actinophytocola xinjiangensis]|uniref:DUF4304 domain-containing protein n=1 Tax=Actinophytocola xinjiangensis TaxID=485602 RepID=A0A7Z1AWX6_9PSEU|nr:DUF4304 domain-containing protein [Actinophytocola xinjiangensis]OLF09435.1 hypothetical protein BLA60_19920 [Actinophytocola xinjiangensis]